MDMLHFQPKEQESEDQLIDARLEAVSSVDEEVEEEGDSGGTSSEDLVDQIGGAMIGGFNKFVDTVKRAAVSQETELMLIDVMQIAQTLLDSEYNSAQILAAVRVLSGFKTNRPCLTNVITTDMKMLKHCFYWWQFAEAAFGWALVHGLKFEAGFSGFAKGAVTSNDDVLMKYCKLERADIKYSYWDSKPGLPGNYVALDHRTKSVVWSIRGSFGLSDVLTDMVAHSVPFLQPQYLAHKGMVKCVESLTEHVWADVVQHQLKDNPGYWLVMTGHSLGAAVASMLAMWVRHNHPDVQVVCWAFASPPCVSLNLSETTKDYIFGLSYGDDVIPRLSLESLAMLKIRLRHVLKEGPGFWASMTQGLAVSSQVEERLKELGVIVGERWAFEIELERDENKFSQRLWPPKNQLYLYEAGDRIVAEESDCRNFGNIVLSSKIMNHHLPTSYDNILIRLIKQLKLEEKEMEHHEEDGTPKKILMNEDEPRDDEPLLKEKEEM